MVNASTGRAAPGDPHLKSGETPSGWGKNRVRAEGPPKKEKKESLSSLICLVRLIT
jgi:hypothetical protein